MVYRGPKTVDQVGRSRSRTRGTEIINIIFTKENIDKKT